MRPRLAVVTTAVTATLVVSSCTGLPSTRSGPSSAPVTSTPVALSPRLPGTVVFTLNPKGTVVAMRADGSRRRVLVQAGSGRPVISPDGRRVVTLANRTDGRPGKTLLVLGLDGRDAHLLQPPDATSFGWAAWLPDGSLAVTAWNEGPGGVGPGLYTVGTDGSGLRRVTKPPAQQNDVPVAASPDGKRVALVRVDWDSTSTTEDLYVATLDGAALRRVSPAGTTVCGTHVDGAVWTSDGAHVLMALRDLTRSSNENSAIFSADADGTGLRRITPWQRWACSVSVSPDGRWAAFSSQGADYEGNRIMVMAVDGSELSSVGRAALSCCPVWAGNRLLYSVQDRGLSMLDPATGTSTAVLPPLPSGSVDDYGWTPVETG